MVEQKNNTNYSSRISSWIAHSLQPLSGLHCTCQGGWGACLERSRRQSLPSEPPLIGRSGFYPGRRVLWSGSDGFIPVLSNVVPLRHLHCPEPCWLPSVISTPGIAPGGHQGKCRSLPAQRLGSEIQPSTLDTQPSTLWTHRNMNSLNHELLEAHTSDPKNPQIGLQHGTERGDPMEAGLSCCLGVEGLKDHAAEAEKANEKEEPQWFCGLVSKPPCPWPESLDPVPPRPRVPQHSSTSGILSALNLHWSLLCILPSGSFSPWGELLHSCGGRDYPQVLKVAL
ncbi:hypothetical protein HJG60_009827 [Phyllostomus discolor]|uniref:Uncharacterized protein n=1 Tax=Phyllostomus discolor TaxID=89673 RepID=A0A834B6U1_9CHIR|nr:hypothetical protein HJG60_009827 [Phyllostomus discolor]